MTSTTDGFAAMRDQRELVDRLRDLLGATLVAYLGSAQETSTVRRWADPSDPLTPSGAVMDRLQTAYEIAVLLAEKDSASVVQAWFQGMNPRLDDSAPARLLREGELDQVSHDVFAAARAFAEGTDPGPQHVGRLGDHTTSDTSPFKEKR